MKINHIKLIGVLLILSSCAMVQTYAEEVNDIDIQVQKTYPSFVPYTLPIGTFDINPDDFSGRSIQTIKDGLTYIDHEEVYILGVGYEPLVTKFNDIESSYWAGQAIQNVIRKGYLPGLKENLFYPNESIMRSQAFQSLDRCLLSNKIYALAYSRERIDQAMSGLDPNSWSKYHTASVLSKMHITQRNQFVEIENFYDGKLTKEEALKLVFGIMKLRDVEICKIEQTVEDETQWILTYAKNKKILPEKELVKLNEPITRAQWTYILDQLDTILTQKNQ